MLKAIYQKKRYQMLWSLGIKQLKAHENRAVNDVNKPKHIYNEYIIPSLILKLGTNANILLTFFRNTYSFFQRLNANVASRWRTWLSHFPCNKHFLHLTKENLISAMLFDCFLLWLLFAATVQIFHHPNNFNVWKKVSYLMTFYKERTVGKIMLLKLLLFFTAIFQKINAHI